MTKKLSTSLAPLQDAADQLAAKKIMPTSLDTKGLNELAVELRARSLFSARVESARILQTVQDKLTRAAEIATERVARGEAFVSKGSFIADLKKIAADEGIDTTQGGITNIGSAARLKLVYETNNKAAYSFARWKASQDPDMLALYPAYEFVRVGPRLRPREDSPEIAKRWSYRWDQAFQPFTGATRAASGRYVALKNHPGWAKLSAFGSPFEPFDFNSGMGLEEVDRDTAAALGILSEQAPDDETSLNDTLQTPASSLAPWALAALTAMFPKEMRVVAGALMPWSG